MGVVTIVYILVKTASANDVKTAAEAEQIKVSCVYGLFALLFCLLMKVL